MNRHHQHLFEVVDKQVKTTDIVTYKPTFGFIGRLANRLFIKNQIESIFEFRRKKWTNYLTEYPKLR